MLSGHRTELTPLAEEIVPEGIRREVVYRFEDNLFQHDTVEFSTLAEAVTYKAIYDGSVKVGEILSPWHACERFNAARAPDLFFLRHPAAAVEQFYQGLRKIVEAHYEGKDNAPSKEEFLTLLDAMWRGEYRLGVYSSEAPHADARGRVLGSPSVHPGLKDLLERFQHMESNGIEFLGGTPRDGLPVTTVELDHPLVEKRAKEKR